MYSICLLPICRAKHGSITLFGVNKMPSLSSYPNVWNTALVILQKKGFAVCHDAANQKWTAEKEGWDFVADDPLELLGLVGVFEHHNPTNQEEYWWKIDHPDLLAQLDPESK